MKRKPVQFIKAAIRRLTVNRKYKDHLFRMIFQDKKDLLELYNAINDSSYTDPDDLTITTLQDVIYLGMKNDLSFIIGSHLNLYEHQSTWNDNMPLRGLFYFSDMLRGYVEEYDLNIYKEKRILLPIPKYIVFYNGTDKQPDRVEMKLSDSYENVADGIYDLECKVTVLNINKGHNQTLMAKSKRLSDYAYFVQAVRENLSQGYGTEEAVVHAVDECIQKNILSDILRRSRAEVVDLFLTTYDAKKHRKAIEEEAREDGLAQGLAEGREKGLAEGRAEGRAEGKDLLIRALHELGIEKEAAVQKVMEKYAVSEEEARKAADLEWEK